MGDFVVKREPGPAWDAGSSMHEQEQWPEHAACMEALVDDGFVVLGGPLGDGSVVLLIVDSGNEDEIRARFAEDPWVPLDLLRIASVEPWEVLLRPDQ
jgi:uncharacterized protein YciI